MRKCWSHCPEDRPSFRLLKDQLAVTSQVLTKINILPAYL